MRKERVASMLAREISRIVAQEVKDPRLGFITITHVDVSADLKSAVVYFTSLKNQPESLETLKRAKGYIRSVLAHCVRMKFIPDLDFRIDDSYEYGRRIDALLEKIDNADKA